MRGKNKQRGVPYKALSVLFFFVFGANFWFLYSLQPQNNAADNSEKAIHHQERNSYLSFRRSTDSDTFPVESTASVSQQGNHIQLNQRPNFYPIKTNANRIIQPQPNTIPQGNPQPNIINNPEEQVFIPKDESYYNFKQLRAKFSNSEEQETIFSRVKTSIRKYASVFGDVLERKYPTEENLPKFGTMFENCYVNTLETTTTVHQTESIALKNQKYLQELTPAYINANPYRTHVITGDIEAMWLRDSMGQFRPYLFGAHSATRPLQTATLIAKASSVLANNFQENDKFQENFKKQIDVSKEKDILHQIYRGWLSFDESLSEDIAETVQGMRLVTEGLIRRQAELIGLVDPLANAFRLTVWSRPLKPFELDQGKGGIIAERKYELDSLCSYLQLVTTFFNQIHESREFTCSLQDAMFTDEIVLQSFRTILHVIEVLQRPAQPISFSFDKMMKSEPKIDLGDCIEHSISIVDDYSNPELPPARWKDIPFTGLSASGFRPSDDVCDYPFHIPSNMFAVATLTSLSKMLTRILENSHCYGLTSGKERVIQTLISKADTLRLEIDNGIHEHAIFKHSTKGEIYCYEVDGNGNCKLMDDANNPSLLGIPHYEYEGVNRDPLRMRALYENTRNFVLSSENPYYVVFPDHAQKGEFRQGGIGSPHTVAGSVWPMSFIIQATTRLEKLSTILKQHENEINEIFDGKRQMNSEEDWLQEVRSAFAEITQLLSILQETTAGTGLMHESFRAAPFTPSSFTRSWFSWANSLYSEAIISSLPLLLPEIFIHK